MSFRLGLAALAVACARTHILDFQFPQGELIDMVARRAAALP